jgi:hypothetical protein
MSSETDETAIIFSDKTLPKTSVQGDNFEYQNDVDKTIQNWDPCQSQPESTYTEDENFFKEWKKTIYKDGSSNVKVTFHVLLPSFEFYEGYPIIVGNIEELGNWKDPIVKLKQQKSEYLNSKSNYWYSNPISIPIERFNNYEVKYKYAFFISKPKIEEKSKFSSLFTKSKSVKNEDASVTKDKKKKNNNDEKNNPDVSSEMQERREDREDQENKTINKKDDEKNENEDREANDSKNKKKKDKKKKDEDEDEEANDSKNKKKKDKKKKDEDEDEEANDSKNKKKKDKKNKEEGDLYLEEDERLRLLDKKTGFQFDIVPSFVIKTQHIELRPLREFVFTNLIFNSITSNNLKDKIMEYQELMINFRKLVLHEADIDFIKRNIQKTKMKEYEKRIFLCLLLGNYIHYRQESFGRFGLPNGFPTAQIIDTLDKFQPDVLPREFYNILKITMTAVIRLNVTNRSFDWLKLFKVAGIIDPHFSFIEVIQDLNYSNERMRNFLKEFAKSAKSIVNQINNLSIYSNIGRVS